VAIAAPFNPSSGKGSQPLISEGHKMIFNKLANHKLRIAMAALPMIFSMKMGRKKFNILYADD
jgi:hypothetical protein